MISFTVLLENNSNDDKLKSEHGLSLYIEEELFGETRKILFDFGQTDSYIDNAKELGVDLTLIDFGVLSHGHYDHGGGLPAFMKLNPGPVYVSDAAFGDYYSVAKPMTKKGDLEGMTPKYIGISKGLESDERIRKVPDFMEIYSGVYIVSGVSGKQYNPQGNKRLLMKTHNSSQPYVWDTFAHEQNMVIIHEDMVILFAGCAHSGIVNIVHEVESRLSQKVSHIISGLHLYNKALDLCESDDLIEGVASYLKNKDLMVYTGHCTGDSCFDTLKETLGPKIHKMEVGMKVLLQ